MKKIALFVIIGFSVNSCLKNRYDQDQSAVVNYKIETSFDEMTNISDQAITGNLVYYKSDKVTFLKPGQQMEDKIGCNVIVTVDTLGSLKTVTVDYGISNCECNDGKLRRGKIVTTFTGSYFSEGTVITHTPVDYYVNDIKIEGTKTVQNMGLNSLGRPFFNVQIDGTGTFPNGDVVSYTSTRVRTWMVGFTTPFNRYDDEYDITGTAQATFSTGGGYTAETLSPIKIKVGCPFPVSGQLKIVPQTKPERTFDYGNGACDQSFSITVNGHTYIIP